MRSEFSSRTMQVEGKKREGSAKHGMAMVEVQAQLGGGRDLVQKTAIAATYHLADLVGRPNAALRSLRSRFAPAFCTYVL